MGGRSPNYDEKLAKKTEVSAGLRAAYGDKLAIAWAMGSTPASEAAAKS